ncbi:hypothetical protein ACLOJK_024996 [Asimina triloba]
METRVLQALKETEEKRVSNFIKNLNLGNSTTGNFLQRRNKRKSKEKREEQVEIPGGEGGCWMAMISSEQATNRWEKGRSGMKKATEKNQGKRSCSKPASNTAAL